MRCGLRLAEGFEYLKERGVEPYPVIMVQIYRRELGEAVSTEALVDTGFDGALILSRPLGCYISGRVKPDGFEELDAAGIGIPCDVYVLNVHIGGRWFRVKSHLPRAGDLGTIVGRILLNRLYLCFRGPEYRLHIAERRLSS